MYIQIVIWITISVNLYKIMYIQIVIWITISVNLIFDVWWNHYYRVWLDYHILVG
jgi:hypothetical protein